MGERQAASERERAIAILAECEQRLLLAEAGVRSAGTVLQRAMRAVTTAEHDLGDASRRLHWFGVPATHEARKSVAGESLRQLRTWLDREDRVEASAAGAPPARPRLPRPGPDQDADR